MTIYYVVVGECSNVISNVAGKDIRWVAGIFPDEELATGFLVEVKRILDNKGRYKNLSKDHVLFVALKVLDTNLPSNLPVFWHITYTMYPGEFKSPLF